MEDRGHFGEQTSDIVAHERTYHAFSVLVRWSMLLIGNAIFWFTMWFATPAGFLGATVAAVLTFVLGYMFVVRHEQKQPLNVWVEGR
jgi:predicted membrane protein